MLYHKTGKRHFMLKLTPWFRLMFSVLIFLIQINFWNTVVEFIPKSHFLSEEETGNWCVYLAPLMFLLISCHCRCCKGTFQVKEMNQSLLTLGNLNSLYFNTAEASSPGGWQRALGNFTSKVKYIPYLCAKVLHSFPEAEMFKARSLSGSAFPHICLHASS